jgi:hypothetical protein
LKAAKAAVKAVAVDMSPAYLPTICRRQPSCSIGFISSSCSTKSSRN